MSKEIDNYTDMANIKNISFAKNHTFKGSWNFRNRYHKHLKIISSIYYLNMASPGKGISLIEKLNNNNNYDN